MSNPDISVARRSKVAPFAGTEDGIRVEGEEFGVKAIDANTVEFTLKDPPTWIICWTSCSAIFTSCQSTVWRTFL